MARNNRDMCFQQGKACVYELDSDPNVIRTEWPNGTIDDYRIGEDSYTRRWPDGTVETMPEPVSCPEWPKPDTTDESAAAAA